MPDLRYMGKHHWTQTLLDEKGKFDKVEIIPPGGTVSVDAQVAERLLQGPRETRLFVAAGSSEDPASSDYVRSKWDSDIEVQGGNYVSPDHLREFGSTIQGGRVIFRTEGNNEENFPVAPADEGPQSDNEALYAEDEVQAAAQEARDKARESQSAKRTSSSAKSSGSGTSGGDTGQRSASTDRPKTQGSGQA